VQPDTRGLSLGLRLEDQTIEDIYLSQLVDDPRRRFSLYRTRHLG
jgi:hypothetical protein